jgi:hypothetical protein
MNRQVSGTLTDALLQHRSDSTPSTMVINLRGTKFEVESRYLKRYPSSLLYRKFEDAQKENAEGDAGKIELFFDHNPALFQHVWDAYVQNADGGTGSGCTVRGMHVPSNYCTRYVEQELTFWGLDESVLELCCWDRLVEGQENDETLAAVVRDWQKADMLRNDNTQLTRRQRMHLFLEEPRVSRLAMVKY